ncbi:MAG: metallophosphoesterase [Desulfovibrionaceae bacterium]|nr:metallophosphoesterase [Desulfovibrionaceae bacterium]
MTESALSRRHSRAAVIKGAVAGIAVFLAACAGGLPNDPASAPSHIQAAWTEIGSGNQLLARVVTSYAPASAREPVCPYMVVDGAAQRMSLRVAAGTARQRPTASDPADSKPSAFPVSVCEALVFASAKNAVVAGRTLPLAKPSPRRIAVIGDSGCRLKKADKAWQACNDASAWPFAAVAAAAAAMNPDLVLHVGDYDYRENACPPDVAGCQGSPWGYGWDTWRADLFTPATPLLAKAPWIVVRGNHEGCARAGQGWYRFLDTRPYSARLSCDIATNDDAADHADPYAVALGADTQVIVFDSSRAEGKVAPRATDPRFATYENQFSAVAALAARPGMNTTIFASHHPVLAFVPAAGKAPKPGNRALQSVMQASNGQAYYPAGVTLALHGHVHGFQAISFASNHPAAIVTGNAGDTLDAALPNPLPANAAPAPGTVIDRITHHASFGFLMMERPDAAAAWTFKVYTVAGQLLTTCNQSGSKLACDKTGFLAP